MDMDGLSIPTREPIAELLSLEGKCAVVTGSSRGIGQGIALRLAEAGAVVVVTGRDTAALQQTRDLISAEGGTVLTVAADLADLSEGRRLIDTAVEQFGGVDVLVNNAAAFERMISLEMTERVWDETVDTDLKAPFFLSQYAAKAMIAAGKGGRIINILSTDAFQVSGFLVAYNAAKAGLLMVTKSMAKELAEHQIRVNAVAPGGTMTVERLEALQRGELGSFKVPEDAAQTRAKMQQMITGAAGGVGPMSMPLGRPGFPDDIAKAVLFLASPMGDYVSGESILVEGGQILR